MPPSLPPAATTVPSAPLPTVQTTAVRPYNPNVLLSEGTVLRLRYPRTTPLELSAAQSRQEVLLLEEDVRDRAGNVVFPRGSQVIGRFETDRSDSQFIIQAISLRGRNLLIQGESDSLTGDREVSSNRLLRNSAIGALGATLLGVLTGGVGFLGLAAGAATGAATTYFTAPKPAVIQPNQVIEVRLTEDLPR